MLTFNPVTGESYFCKRRRRFDADRMPRELTFSCFRGLPLLNRDRTRRWFVEALDSKRRVWPIDLWAWVIMPEHIHLLVAPRERDVAVVRFQGAVKELVSRKALTWLESHAPQWIERLTVREGTRLRRRFWQPGGGYDRNVDNSETLVAAINYLHLNPVKRGLVSCAEDWPWSSAGWYAGIRPAILELDPVSL